MRASTQKTKPNSVPLDSSLQRLEARHRALLAELSDLGLVLRGSIAHRSARCGQPSCRCKADPPRLHGPYYVWTRKVAGKTVTAQLRSEHAARFQDWSCNMRKLDRILRHLQAIGLRAAQLLRR
jgi:hypothetical protein